MPRVEPALRPRTRACRALSRMPRAAVRVGLDCCLARSTRRRSTGRESAFQCGRGRLHAGCADVAGDALERVSQPLGKRAVAFRERVGDLIGRGALLLRQTGEASSRRAFGFLRRGTSRRSCRGRQSPAGPPAAPAWRADRVQVRLQRACRSARPSRTAPPDRSAWRRGRSCPRRDTADAPPSWRAPSWR